MRRGLKASRSRSRLGTPAWSTLLGGLFLCGMLLAGFAVAPLLAP
jgi:hypothetical protein